jgi:hypothetical protein
LVHLWAATEMDRRKFRRTLILARNRMAEVPSWSALPEDASQGPETDFASGKLCCKILTIMGL